MESPSESRNQRAETKLIFYFEWNVETQVEHFKSQNNTEALQNKKGKEGLGNIMNLQGLPFFDSTRNHVRLLPSNTELISGRFTGIPHLSSFV